MHKYPHKMIKQEHTFEFDLAETVLLDGKLKSQGDLNQQQFHLKLRGREVNQGIYQ